MFDTVLTQAADLLVEIQKGEWPGDFVTIKCNNITYKLIASEKVLTSFIKQYKNRNRAKAYIVVNAGGGKFLQRVPPNFKPLTLKQAVAKCGEYKKVK